MGMAYLLMRDLIPPDPIYFSQGQEFTSTRGSTDLTRNKCGILIFMLPRPILFQDVTQHSWCCQPKLTNSCQLKYIGRIVLYMG